MLLGIQILETAVVFVTCWYILPPNWHAIKVNTLMKNFLFIYYYPCELSSTHPETDIRAQNIIIIRIFTKNFIIMPIQIVFFFINVF